MSTGLALAWIWKIICAAQVHRALRYGQWERSYRIYEQILRESPLARGMLGALVLKKPRLRRRIYTVLKVRASTALTSKYFYNINYELHYPLVHLDPWDGWDGWWVLPPFDPKPPLYIQRA